MSAAAVPEPRGFPWWGILLMVIGAVGVVGLVGLRLAFQPFSVSSEAMEPTLHKGDYLFAGKLSQVARGDVVFFRLPRDGRTIYIKRLIGMPGDKIQFKAGALFINGVEIEHKAVGRETFESRQVTRVRETLPGGATFETYDEGPDHDGDTTEVYVVPAGHYFIVGDYRDNSLDSRWPSEYRVGYVPAANIIGALAYSVRGSK